MKFIKAGLLLVLLSVSYIVAAATDVLEPEQWAMVVLVLFLVGIQVARTKRAAEPLGLDN
jgi:energy-converting hydrogenase Eha subunit C